MAKHQKNIRREKKVFSCVYPDKSKNFIAFI